MTRKNYFWFLLKLWDVVNKEKKDVWKSWITKIDNWFLCDQKMFGEMKENRKILWTGWTAGQVSKNYERKNSEKEKKRRKI